MFVKAGERRRSERVQNSRPALLRSRDGTFSTPGHVTNASENGMFFVTRDAPALPREGTVTIELAPPDGAGEGAEPGMAVCRIVRVRAMSHMVALGLERI